MKRQIRKQYFLSAISCFAEKITFEQRHNNYSGKNSYGVALLYKKQIRN